MDGNVVLQSSPSRVQYVWPLEVGRTWEQAVLEQRPLDRETIEHMYAVTVDAEEIIKVVAGSFRTLRIVYRDKRADVIIYETWYSPELKSPVKIRERAPSGLRVRELIGFKLN